MSLIIYGSETWSLTVGLIRRIKVAQRAMERALFGDSLRDQIRNEEIYRRTKIVHSLTYCEIETHCHFNEQSVPTDGCWGRKILEWWPQTIKRSLDTPPTRCTNGLLKITGIFWDQAEQDEPLHRPVSSCGRLWADDEDTILQTWIVILMFSGKNVDIVPIESEIRF